MGDEDGQRLAAASRCLLACGSAGGPLVVPLPFWYDGQGAWMTTGSGSATAQRLAATPACTVCVPGDDAVTVATGEARVFGLRDPLRLALHAGPVSGALAALAVRNADTLAGYARDALLAPARLHSPAVIRVRVHDLDVRPHAPEGPGVAPALPAVVPADVRRAVGGRRRVVVVHGGARPDVTPAVWDAGFVLAGPHGRPEPEGQVGVALTADPDDGRPAYGLVLHGAVDGGRLVPRRVSWWRGFDVETADLPADRARGIVLPE